MEHRIHLIGSNVKYVGEGRNIAKASYGVVVGYVKDQLAAVCDFGGETYIVYEENLKPFLFTEKDKGPEVVKIKKHESPQ